jgi:hypothetical protein
MNDFPFFNSKDFDRLMREAMKQNPLFRSILEDMPDTTSTATSATYEAPKDERFEYMPGFEESGVWRPFTVKIKVEKVDVMPNEKTRQALVCVSMGVMLAREGILPAANIGPEKFEIPDAGADFEAMGIPVVVRDYVPDDCLLLVRPGKTGNIVTIVKVSKWRKNKWLKRLKYPGAMALQFLIGCKHASLGAKIVMPSG